MKVWYWLSVPYYTVRIEVDEFDKIIYTGSINKWMTGKNMNFIRGYLKKKFGDKFDLRRFEDG